jgi:hypothetical protein
MNVKFAHHLERITWFDGAYNKVARRIFSSKRNAVTQGRRKFHNNEELHNFSLRHILLGSSYQGG